MIRAVMGNLVFFHYDQGFRAQKVALQLFKDFQGVIQTDGRLKIDNNLGENAIRPIALGRKNWLFFNFKTKITTAPSPAPIKVLRTFKRNSENELLFSMKTRRGSPNAYLEISLKQIMIVMRECCFR